MVSSSSNIAVQEKEAHSGFPSFSKYTISAVDPQAALSASISISSTSYGQTLVIPVTLIHVAAVSAVVQGQYPFSENDKSLCRKPQGAAADSELHALDHRNVPRLSPVNNSSLLLRTTVHPLEI